MKGCIANMLILDLRMYVFIVLVTITAGTDYESIILLFLSSTANLSTISSNERPCESSFSIERMAKSTNRCSDIVVRK